MTAVPKMSFPQPETPRFLIGRMKWFGGFNKNTGASNDYGFIERAEGDVYVHRRDLLCASEELVAGAEVIYEVVADRFGKPAAKLVQSLSRLLDDERVRLVAARHALSAVDKLKIMLSGSSLIGCEEAALEAISEVDKTPAKPAVFGRFWERFPPATPKDPFYQHAPAGTKDAVCRRYYKGFKDMLASLFSSVNSASISLAAPALYGSLTAEDRALAAAWAGPNPQDAVLAKMLSARAAEKAAAIFYEQVGLRVQDTSIGQLDAQSKDWITHDLLVDGTVSVDVKNSRCPVNGENFYVEHTIAKFKVDRRSNHVRIAGILSPYLQLQYINDPGKASFNLSNVLFLGETARDSIDALVATFGSPKFEVIRNERTFPNWVFSYPSAWYSTLQRDLTRFVEDCEWPEGDEWNHIFDEEEKIRAVPALSMTGKALPPPVLSHLAGWQTDFLSRLLELGRPPKLPVIFIAVLSDFLDRVHSGPAGYTPTGYRPLLFSGKSVHGPSYPLGVIDPLGLVEGLISTLDKIWEHREKVALQQFTGFRFGGLGILQGREKLGSAWKTVFAYCGGTAYKTDGTGAVLLTAGGTPQGIKGKCGYAPLIAGVNKSCSSCGKLICNKCGFCSQPCQDSAFRAIAREQATRAETEQRFSITEEAGRWEEVPLHVYEDELRAGPAR